MKKKRTKIFSKIFIALCIILAIFTGGFFYLDKIIVPKYFSSYGITDIPDLVGVVTSLYKSPKESKLVTNAYTDKDLGSAVSKLQTAGYKIEDDGTILKENFSVFKGDGQFMLTDKEFAAVCDRMCDDGILEEFLPKLNYLNVMNITLLELIITPDETSFDGEGYTKSNISFICKIDTTDINEHMAEQMDTPKFLLDMIIPKTLYFEVSYDLDIAGEGSSRADGSIAINGRSESQSKILINLLIDFIFPAEEEMDIEKFTNSLGDIILEGIDALGNFKFTTIQGTAKVENGILVNP